MTDAPAPRVAVIGLGFMGRTHIRAYRAAGARLAGVFDLDPDRLTGRPAAGGNLGPGDDAPLFDPADLLATSDLDELLAAADIDAVSICTPTDTHVDLAARALRAGKHVLVEKPVALESAAVAALAGEARAAGRLCMPAMCMRFWPAWAWIASAIDDQRFGPVRAARFERLGAAPAWGAGFYDNTARSGGALFDLHVHDTDFVVRCFGAPDAVTSAGDHAHVSTLYRFPGANPPHVSSQGGWLRGPGLGFRMRCFVEFDAGVADFDIARDDALRFAPATSDRAERVELPAHDGYQGEIEAFLDAIANARNDPPVTLEDALTTTAVLEAERDSLATGGTANVNRPHGAHA